MAPAPLNLMRDLAAMAVAAAVLWPGAGGAIELGLPVDCTPGETCWLVQYVDVDPGPGRRDYMCGWLSYDGANGTDIGLADLAAMRRGIAVVAAAAGTVTAVRNDMDDVDVRSIGRDALDGKDCGNGVGIDHGGGWKTQYCHLRRKSITVSPGDRVAAGHPLGLVGLSGNTEFPHLELIVRHNDMPVDPFVGLGRTEACGPGPRPLWRPDALDTLAYQSAILANAGFAVAPPRLDAVRDGLYDTAVFSPDAAALFLWVDLYWARPGDRLRFRITRPDGTALITQEKTVEKTVARDMYHAGVRYGGTPWPAGTYRGEVVLERPDGPIGPETHTLSRTITVEPAG